MGLFLALAGVINVEEASVIAALSGYAKAKNGIFQIDPQSRVTDDTLTIYSAHGNTCVLFPENLSDWWDASHALSLLLKKVVLALHIHDGDLWMYTLYKRGTQVDAFNPIPDYWGEVSDAERQANRGNAKMVADCIPPVQSSDIEKYFIEWALEADDPGKAYPTDEYPYESEWQILDFMKKLKLPYPLDSAGKPKGTTYRFVIPIP